MKNKLLHSVDLLPGEFLFLIQEYNLTISPEAAIAPLLSFKPEGSKKMLFDKGLLDKEVGWYDALLAVCQPDFQISTTLSFSQSALCSNYYCKRSNASVIVACQPKDEYVHLSFPWSVNDIFIDSVAPLNINDTADFNVEKMCMSPATFLYFIAALDAIREVLFFSTLQRQVVSDFRLPKSHLIKMLKISIDDTQADTRWLVTLMRMFAPAGFMPNLDALQDKDLDSLVTLELIHDEANNYWSPGSALLSLAEQLLIPLPAACHEVIINHSDDCKEISHMITLKGSGPICIAEFKQGESGEPVVYFQSLASSTYWLNLAGLLTPPKPDIVSSTSTITCQSCGTHLADGLKFCTQCGQKL